ncbi:TonB-dependent receptor [Caulobacter sp. NIBR1757]|uniref:TonB-dependent receptor n=1 Tax=Caulobacter sp. NIBR1757 TaxID=3016000 RepID=UPI0022F041F4|nr:TonB-dependent receptor [Caulobacter sp. NIBR1757]WGM40280.1 Vitamin B12 transporter BtuB [Caulobacter sp. NIBR1757]
MHNSLRLRRTLAVGVSAFAIMAVAAPAFAQDDEKDTGNTVGELIITAQKREEAIQDVPIAVSAFNQESLEKAKIDGGPNLVLAIPNVNFSKGNFTGYNFQIRGVGSKLVAGSGDAGTGIHLNNAPLTANNLFESEFFDLERVEVLRGPQGTLYGRNATGGVVNVISSKPTDSFEALIRAEYGNYNAKKLRGMINVPIGDMIAIRGAAAFLQRDGYGDNLTTGNDVDDRDLWNTRITVSFEPSDTFRTFLLWDHFEEDDKRSRIGKQLCVKDPGPANIGGTGYSGIAPIAEIQRGLFSQGCQATSVNDPNILGTPDTRATLGGIFGALSGLTQGDAFTSAGGVFQMQDKNIRNIQSSFDPVYQAETDIFQFNAEWDITDSLTVTALTSYSENSLYTRQDYNRIVPNENFNTSPNPVNAFGSAVAAAVISGQQIANCGTTVGACATAVASNPAVIAAANAAYPNIYAGLFPGGVVNDPQVGALNRFATADISGGTSENFSQELRLQSNFDGPLNFNIGGIYLDYKSDGDYYVMGNTLTAYAQIQNVLNTGSANCAATNPACIYIDPNADPKRLGHNYYDNTGAYHLKSRAAFGEVYWQLTDALKITGGLRYTHDRKLVENRPVVLASAGSGIPLSATTPILEADFEEFTGRLVADYKLTDNNLIYGGYSRGYKGGGVNPACSTGVGCPPPTFAPEFVDAWEFGSKNTFDEGRVVANVTGFHYDYIGYQVSKIVNRTSVNENIDAKIYGLELETIWAPIDNLRLNANIGYLHTEIGESESIDTFDRTQGQAGLWVVKAQNASNCVVTTAQAQAALAASAGNPFAIFGLCAGAFGAVSDGVTVNLEGNELPNSPHFTVSLGAQYSMQWGDWDATLRGDYYHQTETYSRIYNSKADKLDAWSNVNATFTVANEGWGLSFELYVKNLTDEEVLTDTYLTDDSSGLFRNGFYGEPRTFGISVTKTFGM